MTPLAIVPLTDISVWVRGNGLEIVLLVLGAVLLGRFVAWVGDRITRRIDTASRDEDEIVRSQSTRHRHALTQVLTWLAKGLIWIVTVMLVLDRLGVPFTSLVAPAALISVAVGIGAQRLVQDLIGGMLIITERQYGYGDLVNIAATTMTDGTEGTVEDVTLRVTRVRTAGGELVTVSNGQVIQVTNLSKDWARAVVDVPLQAGVDVARANEVLRKVCEDAYDDEELKPLLLDKPTVMGVESLEIGQVNLRMVVRTLPGKQFDVERKLRARVAKAMREAGIVGAEDDDSAVAAGEET